MLGTEDISKLAFGKGNSTNENPRVKEDTSPILQVQTLLEGRQGGTEKRRVVLFSKLQFANQTFLLKK